MRLTVYHLKTCDTCRKCIKALKAEGFDLTLIDVRADGIPAQDLTDMVAMVGYHKLLNTRSTTWRGLSDEDKADMDAQKALKLMTEHPTLIKRPIIDNGDGIFVGWKQDVQDEFVS